MRARVERGIGEANAKTILLGEHAVVYGRPAIAFPIPALTIQATAFFHDGPLALKTPLYDDVVPADTGVIEPLEKHLAEIALRNTLEFFALTAQNIRVTVEGVIPPARGLGSSAAVAGAIASAVASLHGIALSPEDRFSIVQSVERIAHGTPSGLDAYSTASRFPIWFQNGEATQLELQHYPTLIVADTGESGRTAAAVADVARFRELDRRVVDNHLDLLGDLTVQAREDLEQGEVVKLGGKLTHAHGILQDLGVSSDRLDELVSAALDHGALGAKLTGGGQGGCIVALVESSKQITGLTDALLSAGAVSVWPIHRGEGGAW